MCFYFKDLNVGCINLTTVYLCDCKLNGSIRAMLKYCPNISELVLHNILHLKACYFESIFCPNLRIF